MLELLLENSPAQLTDTTSILPTMTNTESEWLILKSKDQGPHQPIEPEVNRVHLDTLLNKSAMEEEAIIPLQPVSNLLKPALLPTAI